MPLNGYSYYLSSRLPDGKKYFRCRKCSNGRLRRQCRGSLILSPEGTAVKQVDHNCKESHQNLDVVEESIDSSIELPAELPPIALPLTQSKPKVGYF